MEVLWFLSPNSRDALSDSLSNDKFKSSTRHHGLSENSDLQKG
jgi:hypothetical protein